MVLDIVMVKDILTDTSLNLGKPSYLSEDMGPLLGQGIISSSGPIWAHQRKIITPELYLDKVKAMVGTIVDSTNIMVRSWETKIEGDGVISEITVDEDLRSLSADIIARVCFGSNYVEGKEIFAKLRDLIKLLSKINLGIPGYRYLPNKRNIQIWRLEKEINSKILKLVKQCQEKGSEQFLLQTILEGAKNCEGSDGLFSNSISQERFIIDNCKSIFFAGHDTTAITSTWCLILLAKYQDWQDRARAEVLEVCRDGNLDASNLRKMKTLTMVIQETLRLYSPVLFAARTTLKDYDLKGIKIPKGITIQIPIPIFQEDKDIWGVDAHEFKPERFSNGVLGSCKFPQAYMPFGIGSRVCPGQHLGMIELKVILSLILSKFRFSLSSTYCHSPTLRILIEPGHDVVLKMTKI
ncbi:putative unspecific monooxygenase [Medicago truncatula]|nr:putative unspecific monooxygenase [Medicago truncatula]